MQDSLAKQNNRRPSGCLSVFFQRFLFAAVLSTLLFILLSVFAALNLSLPALSQADAAKLPLASGSASSRALSCQVSPRFPENVLQWCLWITEYSIQHDLPPDLVAALIWQESGGSSLAYSRSGAVGLMQIMPSDGPAAKFMCKNGPCFADRPSIVQLQDAEFNIRYGTGLLKGLLKHHQGDLRRALKSYGPMDAGYQYADTVLALYNRYGNQAD